MMTSRFVSSESLLAERLDAHAEEIRARGLLLHCELDAGFQMRPRAGLDAALEALIRFVLSTIPAGCEVYLASTRSAAPVSRLGEGRLILRWQVSGDPQTSGNLRSLRPRAGDAATHAASKSGLRVRAAFAAVGWGMELVPLAAGRELMARIECRGGD